MKHLFAFSLFVFFVLPDAHAGRFYLDPVNGSMNNSGTAAAPWSTLHDVIANNLIESQAYSPLPYTPASQLVAKNSGAPVKAGDTLVLMSGMHGEVSITGYYNKDFITVMAGDAQTPVLSKLSLAGGEKWRFLGLTVSSEPAGYYINSNLIYAAKHNFQGPAKHIVIENCHIFSTQNPWTTAQEWLNKVSNGINISADSSLVQGNALENVSFGIILSGDFITARNNTITNFSADGMRMVASHLVVEYNVIKNCYKVDANHDDGIQSFTTGGVVVDDNIVRGNIILNYEDPNQPLLGDMQGIGCFDGFYNNWLVENNVIFVNHWHGISFYGANNCIFVNNTVLDPTPQTAPGGAWIKIHDHKQGTPSANCVVYNNVANAFQIATGSALTGNNITLSTTADYQANFVNPAGFDFHLLPSSILVDAADASYAPPLDLDSVPRPQGSAADIGAYELVITGKPDDSAVREVGIWPNPFTDRLTVSGVKGPSRVELVGLDGRIWLSASGSATHVLTLNTHRLPHGIYWLVLRQKGGTLRKFPVVKL